MYLAIIVKIRQSGRPSHQTLRMYSTHLVWHKMHSIARGLTGEKKVKYVCGINFKIYLRMNTLGRPKEVVVATFLINEMLF